MRPYWTNNETYEFFDEFLQNCILDDKSLLFNENYEVFTSKNLEKICQEIEEHGDDYLVQIKKFGDEFSKAILIHALLFWAFVDTKRPYKFKPLGEKTMLRTKNSIRNIILKFVALALQVRTSWEIKKGNKIFYTQP